MNLHKIYDMRNAPELEEMRDEDGELPEVRHFLSFGGYLYICFEDAIFVMLEEGEEYEGFRNSPND